MLLSWNKHVQKHKYRHGNTSKSLNDSAGIRNNVDIQLIILQK